jgi:hypothetical protein
MTAEVRQTQRRFSTRLIRKGALIEETYRCFQVWDRDRPLPENLDRIRETNPFGAANQAWLREVVVTISGRFRSQAQVRPLVALAQRGLPIEQWRAFLLWHVGQTDALYYSFATRWLFDAYWQGLHNLRTEAVVPILKAAMRNGRASHHGLSEYGLTRGARDLLRMAGDFGLLHGKAVKNFTAYQVPESGFLYALHALTELEPNCRKMMDRPEWRLFLLSPGQVEREVLNLHQFRKLEYHTAGSLAQLKLPCASAVEFAEHLKS